jgi:hypothetical protein
MAVRGLRAGAASVALLVAATFATGVVPAFADDAPSTTTTTTTEPATTTSSPPTTTSSPPTTTTEPVTTPKADAPDPSTQATPGVTVTPSTGLVNFQTVTIAGSGFTPGVAVGWSECKHNGSGSAADCDTGNTGFTIPDASGSFSAPFTVRRIIDTANGMVDCASAPEACTVGAGTVTQPSAQSANVPISFDPNAPLPPPPTLTVDPVIGLHDGASLAVSGSGYIPSSQVAIVQCSVPASAATCQTLSLLPADTAGTFSTHVIVHRLVATPPFGATDCAAAPGTCQLTAVSLADYYDYSAHVELAFDPDGPLPPGEVTVTPDTGLVQFQSVTIAGSGFSPSAGVEVVECRADATSPSDCVQSAAFQPTSATGTFSLAYPVRRVLRLASGDFDCASAPGACTLVSSSFGASTVVVVSPISFDPSAPLPPDPTISVAPSTDLVHGQTVTVTGAHFAPVSPVVLSECSTSSLPPGGFCGFGGPVTVTDASGAFSTTFVVKRSVPDLQSGFPPQPVDCAASPGTCSLVAGSFDFQDHAQQALDFDASVPIPSPDTSVSPQTGIADRALVHVHSAGFQPGELVALSECAAGSSPYTQCLDARTGPLHADASGVVDTDVRVHRQITSLPNFVLSAAFAPGPVDCASAFGACVLRVQAADDQIVLSDTPLGFDPNAVAPPPAVAVDPGGPYADGQQVTVHGTGFTPHASLGVAQCAAGVDPGPTTCDEDDWGILSFVPVDGDGTFTQSLALHATMETSDHTVDCRAPGSCVLLVNRGLDAAERVTLPLTFGGVDVLAAPRALAFTGAGSDTRPAIVLGSGLALLGTALVLLTRARRRA